MRDLLSRALTTLGIEHLSCAVHERALPPDERLDAGCGAPGGPAAADFAGFLAEQGFNVVQLGPPGEVSAHNVSPYDGTAFSRSRLQLSWSALEDGPLAGLDEPDPTDGRAERCDYPRAFATVERRWAALHARWEALDAARDPRLAALTAGLADFRRREGSWLQTDALFTVLSRLHGGEAPSRWREPGDALLFSPRAPEAARRRRLDALIATHAKALERFAREQYLLLAQHRRFVSRAHGLGLAVWADLQVGLSQADRWANEALMLQGYAMGAPPSRTNPEGQPWGYPVLDPGHAEADAFRAVQFSRLFRDYDGVRVDHPHGLVCPWAYQLGTDDPAQAVRDGARLFSVGSNPRHSKLAALDIARADQLDPREGPWADHFVTGLDEAQVERYARVFDALLDAARAAGHGTAVACEVLSTMPFPLGAVLARHGLGRYRVTQKANVLAPDDVYLPANAVAQDWMMVGTHDTAPIWRTAAAWSEAVAGARLEHAVRCLAPDGVGREALARHFGQSRHHLAFAELTVLFTTRARHVLLWVFDLLGSEALYNRPGVMHPDNWTLRIPAAWRAEHEARAKTCGAFDPGAALALALLARPRDERRAAAALIRALASRALAPVPGLEERLA